MQTFHICTDSSNSVPRCTRQWFLILYNEHEQRKVEERQLFFMKLTEQLITLRGLIDSLSNLPERCQLAKRELHCNRHYLKLSSYIFCNNMIFHHSGCLVDITSPHFSHTYIAMLTDIPFFWVCCSLQLTLLLFSIHHGDVGMGLFHFRLKTLPLSMVYLILV
jgi:hypothetical protein